MGDTSQTIKTPKEIYKESRKLTIPNLLTGLRIALIPVFIWLYSFQDDYDMAALVLLISGLTDILDGTIARKFNMISDLGKILDPIADKLTQAALLVCLSSRYPLMIVIFALMIAKESLMTWSGYQVVKKTGIVLGAQWHGKAATVLLYTTLLLHAFWLNIPETMSSLLIGACLTMIVLSGVLYYLRNTSFIQQETAK